MLQTEKCVATAQELVDNKHYIIGTKPKPKAYIGLSPKAIFQARNSLPDKGDCWFVKTCKICREGRYCRRTA